MNDIELTKWRDKAGCGIHDTASVTVTVTIGGVVKLL